MSKNRTGNLVLKIHPTTRQKIDAFRSAKPTKSVMGTVDEAMDLLLASEGLNESPRPRRSREPAEAKPA